MKREGKREDGREKREREAGDERESARDERGEGRREREEERRRGGEETKSFSFFGFCFAFLPELFLPDREKEKGVGPAGQS